MSKGSRQRPRAISAEQEKQNYALLDWKNDRKPSRRPKGTKSVHAPRGIIDPCDAQPDLDFCQ